MRRLSCLLFTCILINPTSAFCWWEVGHQTIARIAAAHLTTAARTHIARILDVPDTAADVADGLARGSTWPDEIRKDNPETGPWHFIDLTLQDQKSDMPARCKDDNCAPARIRLFAAQLSAPPATSSRWSPLDALRFLVHFVGDIHQPLHAVSDADLGGNCELLDPPVDTAKNLHGLWDGGMLTEISADSRQLSADLNRGIDGWPGGRQSDLLKGNQDDWVWESHLLAQKDIYNLLPIPVEPVIFPASCHDAPAAIASLRLNITSEYTHAMQAVINDQLTKAGLRLAKMLNESL